MDRNEIEIKLEQIQDRFTIDGISAKAKEEILRELDSILSIDPKNTDALFWKALAFQVTEDYETAIKIFEEILTIEPDNETIKESLKSCKEIMAFNIKPDSNIGNPNSNDFKIMEKVSVWHILIFKIVVIAAIIYLIFMPVFTGN